MKSRQAGLATMARHYAITMKEAAKALSVSRQSLFALLRERRHFLIGNVPDLSLIRAGYFRLETRGFVHPGLGAEKQYQRVLVSTEGLLWLQELIRAERRKDATPVGAGNRCVANAGRTQSSVATSARAMGAVGTDAFEKYVGAASAAEISVKNADQ